MKLMAVLTVIIQILCVGDTKLWHKNLISTHYDAIENSNILIQLRKIYEWR